jgi:hypothetical protein
MGLPTSGWSIGGRRPRCAEIIHHRLKLAVVEDVYSLHG